MTAALTELKDLAADRLEEGDLVIRVFDGPGLMGRDIREPYPTVVAYDPVTTRLRHTRPLDGRTIETVIGPGKRFDVLRGPRPPAKDPTRFPHACPRCAAPAYVGFLRVECSVAGCGP